MAATLRATPSLLKVVIVVHAAGREVVICVVQVRDAVGEISTVGDAALRTIPVVRARATVTELVTGESMTATGAVGLDWCAAVTTVRSLEPTTTRRTTAVRDQLEEMTDINSHPQTGAPGRPGGVWLLELSRGNRSAGNSSAVSLTAGWAPGTPRRDTQTLNVFKLLRYHTMSQ